LRLGELLHLQWSDIDLERRKMAIRRKDFWIPKSGDREIPLNDGMIRLLKGMKPKKVLGQGFVFPGKDGGKMKTKLRKELIRIATAASISDLTKVHSLRHTFASQLVMKGVDLPTVQRLLGHTDIQTTMIYSHLAPDHLVEAVNKLGFEGRRSRRL
jgi:integrase